MSEIGVNIHKVYETISLICKGNGRKASDIKLVAACKGVSLENILEAEAEGIKIFGENRLQDATSKIRKAPAHICWHMIGHLQSNKARKAVDLFEMIQSVDSLQLAEKLESIAEESQKDVEILLEVNIGKEENKYGFFEEEIPRAVSRIRSFQKLKLLGLMTQKDIYINTLFLIQLRMEQLYHCFML